MSPKISWDAEVCKLHIKAKLLSIFIDGQPAWQVASDLASPSRMMAISTSMLSMRFLRLVHQELLANKVVVFSMSNEKQLQPF